jgi:hypothetical protein
LTLPSPHVMRIKSMSRNCNNNINSIISHHHNRLTMTTLTILISEATPLGTTFQTIEGVKVKNMKNVANFLPHITFKCFTNCTVRRISPLHPLQRHNHDTAADTREPIAALVSFQWYSPSNPPYQNVNSAVLADVPACHFGGCMAQQ